MVLRARKSNRDELVTPALAEDQLLSVIAYAPMAAVIWQGERIIHANQLFLDMFGCKNLADAEGQPVAAYFSDKDADSASAEETRRYAREMTTDVETTGSRKDGSRFPFRLHVSRIGSPDRPMSLGYCSDLTESRLAEEPLRRTQFSIDHAADLVYWVDNEGRLIDASASTGKSLGFSRDELLGMTIFDFTVGPTRETWPETWEATKKGSYTIERELRTKDGHTFPVTITVNYVAHEGREYNCVFAHDVTARKLAEARIRHLSSFPESNPSPVLEFDREGRVLYANPAAHAEGIRLGLSGLRAFLPLDDGELRSLMSQSAASYFCRELTIGDRVFAETLTFLPDFASVRVFASDVTERKQTEQSLGLTEFSVDHAADLIHWIDSEGRIIFANEAGCRRDGYSRKEMLSMRIFDLDPALTPEALRERWRRVKKAGAVTFESAHRTKGGELYPVEVSANYMEQGGREYVFAFVRDITERKRAGELLQESEERLRLALVASNQGTWDLDLRSGQAVVSSHYALMLGYEPEEYHLTLDEFRASLEPEDRVHVEAAYKAHVRGEQPAYEAEYRRQTKSGDWKWFRTLGMVTQRDEKGVPVRMVGTQSDITERKQAEEALRQSEQQLRQAQKMEAVGQLAGGIAHDFNNVLTTIIGYSDLILASEECNAGSLRADVGEIKTAAERASSLTRQILAFSRRQALKPEVLSLNDALETTERLLRRTLGEDIHLITLLRPDLGLVEVDAHQFEQVLVNLALNARDAMPTGGKLTLETTNVELNREYCKAHPGTKRGAYVMLAVSDTGLGMDEETKSHVFEPFFTTKEPGKGTGLGLAMVYGVVKQSGGSIFVYSEPGKGSTFKVYLPRVDKPARTRSGTARSADSVAGSETILVVEDEAAVRELVRRVLERLGYGVLAVGSGDEALPLLEEADSPVDLLLTDIVLPGSLQGNELAREAVALWPRLPVLYMSGYTRNAIVHAGRLDEGVNYIEKPFTPGNLARRVREVLDCRSASG